jgi:hypothetical protein
MASIKVAFINESSVLKDAEVQATIKPLRTQVSRDFAPVWGMDADLGFVAKNTKPTAKTWVIGVFDDSDQAGALGYHDLTENKNTMNSNRHSDGTFRAFLWLSIAAIGVQFFLSPARAEEAAKPSPSSLPKVTAAEPGPAGSPALPVGSPTPLPKVTKVTGLVALHEILEVDCDGLKEWAKTNDPSKLVLYLDGTLMKGLAPKVDKANANRLFFKLERLSGNDESKADNSKAWDALFSRPKGIGKKGTVRVTVGPETGVPFDSDQRAVLYAIDPYWFWPYAVLSVLLLFFIWKVGRLSNLLRDSGPEPAGGRKTYSLARTQMAFWFFVIVVAYLFIFIVTGATDTITTSVLGLMGISAGTGLVAAVVDNSKRAQAQAELDKLRAEQAKLQGQQQAAQAGGAVFPPESLQRLNDLPGLIAKQQAILDPIASQGFRLDILSDADGISFHRLQIAVWTVVLGIIFCVSVYNVLSMPTFSDALLGLLGISGGTYIGFKIPEKLS